MNNQWTEGVKSMRLICREGDSIIVDAPADSSAAEFNGRQGVITGFTEEWIMADVDDIGRRFRHDELKVC